MSNINRYIKKQIIRGNLSLSNRKFNNNTFHSLFDKTVNNIFEDEENTNSWPPPPYIVAARNGDILTLISGLDYTQNMGPSVATIPFRIQALGLDPAIGDITVTPDANFEVYDGTIWRTTPFTIPYTGGAVNTAEIYMIRLKAGLSVNSYTGTLTLSGANASTFIVNLLGNVLINTDFVIIVKTDNVGVSTNNQFRIPLSTGGTYNAVIDWGDNTTTVQNTDISPTHTYSVPGTYTIKISGVFRAIEFNNDGDRLKVLDIKNWGNNSWTTIRFWGCANLTGTYVDIPDTSACITLYALFANCFVFNGIVANWNVSNVTVFRSAFQNCTVFNRPLTGWNTGKGTDFVSMFLVASAFNQPLNFFDMSKALSIESMFNLATAFNQDISSWNVILLTNATNFMVGKSPANYNATFLDAIYNTWSTLILKPNVSINFGTIKYTAAGSAGKTILTNAPNNWIIVDGGI